MQKLSTNLTNILSKNLEKKLTADFIKENP